VSSILYCAQKYCTPEEARAGRDSIAPECEEVGVPFPTIEEASLSEAELENILVLNYTAALATAEEPLGPGVAAIPDVDWHALSKKTVQEFYFNWDTSFTFTFASIAFWGLVVAVGMIHRLRAYRHKPANAPSSPSWWLWIRRTLILPATFGQRQAEAVANAYSIPPRLESILLAIYLLMNIVMCLPGYRLFDGNM
jgi:hypothetical protein